MYQINDIVNTIIQGNALDILKQIPNDSIDCVVTSPPYWSLRNYEIEGQLGQEKTFQEYIEKLIAIFIEVKRVLKPTGTCFVNIGDTYIGKGATRHKGYIDPKYPNGRVGGDCEPSGLKQSIESKNLANIPARFSIAMQDIGFILRNKIIWHKPNVTPSPVKDRFTVDFEEIFFFTKNQRYYFEQQLEKFSESSLLRVKYGVSKNNKIISNNYSINYKSVDNLFKNIQNNKIKGRNKRCVWTIASKPFHGAHFAVFPPGLVKIPIKAGCPNNGIVLDPFMGSGTTAVVAKKLDRNYIGIELNPKYIEIANKRINETKIVDDLFAVVQK
jgi:site-specific DNA-methyltransferase (adenine-specific)